MQCDCISHVDVHQHKTGGKLGRKFHQKRRKPGFYSAPSTFLVVCLQNGNVFFSQILLLMEKQDKPFLLLQLLGCIPWSSGQACTGQQSEVNWPSIDHIRWVCAKFTTRSYVTQNQLTSLFRLVCEAVNWKIDPRKQNAHVSITGSLLAKTSSLHR